MTALGLAIDRISWEERRIIEEVRKRGLKLVVFDLLRSAVFELQRLEENHTLDCDVCLVRSISFYRALYSSEILEKAGYKVVNSSNTIRICGNKLKTTLALSEKGLLVPKTSVAFGVETAIEAVRRMGVPVVIKPLIGSWGRYIAYAADEETAYVIFSDRSSSQNPLHRIFYIQKYLQKERDIRTFVIGDEVVAAIYRYNLPNDWRSSATRGAKTEPCKITPEIEENSLKAAEAVGGGVIGVDLIEHDGQLYLVEVNHSPQFRSLTATTGANIAGRIVDYLLKIRSS